MALIESISPFLATVKENQRLRLGLWIVVGIVWLYGLLLLRDEIRLASSEHQTLAKKAARFKAQSGQKEWIARVEPAQAAQVGLESRLWREGTIGLAQATFQDWLSQVVQQSNLSRTVVAVAAQVSGPENSATAKSEPGLGSDIWKVSAKVSFDFTPKGLYALMGYLEGHDKQVVVETLIVRGPPISRVEMVLVAYFQKPAPVEKVTSANNGNVNGASAMVLP